MQRRKYLAALGSLAAGGAAIGGTGAFSVAWTNRTVSAQIVGDENAYLGLVDESEYARTDGNKLVLDFAGGTPGQNGSGLNEDANTRFFNVFRIQNNGTNDVSIFAVDNPNNLTGWSSSGLALYWTDSEVDESGGAGLANRDTMHKVGSINDPGAAAEEDIPRLTPGDDIWIHPAFLLGPQNTGNTLADVPNQIGFYATRTDTYPDPDDSDLE
jgi:hypothetical protein